MQEEIWKDIPNYEGIYQVSNLGNVKSLNYKRTKKEKNLSSCISSNGYKMVALSKNKKLKSFCVHQLVAISFLNHSPQVYKYHVDHIDNNKLNNYLNNLQVITQRENNSKNKLNKTSKYTGVFWNKFKNKWCSAIRINGKKNNLGCFEDEYEANLAYQNKLKEII